MRSMQLPDPVHALFGHFADLSVIDWLWSLGIMATAVLIGVLLGRVVARATRRWARATDTTLDDTIADGLGPPLRWSMPVLGLRLSLPLTALPHEPLASAGHACTIALLLLGGWTLLRAVSVAEVVAIHRLDVSVSDNLHARSLQTQLRGFRNIARFAIGLLTLALVLMTFEQVRRLGMSLLASAGVAGIVIGFAAQRSIATVIAGVQIALSQPIRVDDVVIVEGEWGRIEEITLTYVVVKIWDQRRLIVPIAHFIEKPFQNWTRTSAELLGTVFLYVDYRMPVSALRQELARLVAHNPLWDRRVAQVVVTDAKESTLEVRALVSAADASKLWDLRCAVREGLVDYIQRQHPQCLPTLRAHVEGAGHSGLQ